jgi:hypothetical protein
LAAALRLWTRLIVLPPSVALTPMIMLLSVFCR